MASNERLTKRVKQIEKWIEENEEMGGPKGYLDTMAGLYSNAKDNASAAQQSENKFLQLRSYVFEFLKKEDMAEEWDEFLKDKDDNGAQKQETEELPVPEETEDSKESIEEPQKK